MVVNTAAFGLAVLSTRLLRMDLKNWAGNSLDVTDE